MKIYMIADLFLLGGRAGGNYPCIVIGKQPNPVPAFWEQLISLLDNFTVPAFCSPETLDRLLAAMLRRVKPSPFIIGCTIKVPGINGPTGGVLGNPGFPAAPARGRLERMGDGWKILAFSGGPGLAYKDRSGGGYFPVITGANSGGGGGKEMLLDLARHACSQGVEQFLGLTDGTGCPAGEGGSAIIQYGRDYCLWALDEIDC